MEEENLEQEQIEETPAEEETTTEEETTEEDKPELEFDENGDWIRPQEQQEEEQQEEEPAQEQEETPEEEHKEPEFPERTIEEAEKEKDTITQDGIKEFLTLKEKFLKKAGKPIVMMKNPETGVEESFYANYTAEEAFQHGVETGDYDPFLTSLSPIEVKNFLKEFEAINSKYDSKLEELGNEVEYKKLKGQKEADLKEWDAYIEKECKDNKIEAYLLNKLKHSSGFDKKKVEEFRQWVKEAIALEDSKKTISKQLNSAKKAVMGATPKAAKGGGNRVFTRESIAKMSDAEYEANEAEILRQSKNWK